jgi:pimeloyl-ACP methyl ester carboxylesterase
MSITQAQLIQESLDSSEAVYASNDEISSDENVVPGGDKYVLLDDSTLDNLDSQYISDGFFAKAYLDTTSNTIIIAYEGSLPYELNTAFGRGSLAADAALAVGQSPINLQIAATFAKDVSELAAIEGDGTDSIYVTGHSLGGTEAEAAALQSSTDGVSGAVTFGATGLPDYLSQGGNNNFINYVDYGDPIGNFAHDSVSELNLIAEAVHMGSHFGSVDLVGSPWDAALVAAALLTDDGEALALLSYQYHSLGNYAADLGMTLDHPVAIVSDTPVPNLNPTPDTSPAFFFAQESASTSNPSSPTTQLVVGAKGSAVTQIDAELALD